MKQFIKKALIFIFILTAVLIILDLLSMVEPTRTVLASLTDSTDYISVNVGADEIKPYIVQAAQSDSTTKLILGDSVCHQLFSGLQDQSSDISILGSNAAITPAGQYILAKKYIDSHPGATDIYIFMLPGALGQSFDTNYGYQYTVMPFVETGTIELLEDKTVKDMEEVYGKLFMQPAIVRMIDLSGPNRKLYLNMLKKYSSAYKPDKYFDIADMYIGKIKDICDNSNICLHLHPCPVFESRISDSESLRAEYESSKLHEWFPEYFDEIVYYPDNESSDNVHFNDEFATREHLDEVIIDCYSSFITIDESHIELR